MANTVMMESYTRCWDSAQKGSYEWYVRLRDDIGFRRPFPPNATYDGEEGYASDAIITSSSDVKGGINDRMAIVGPEVANCYFNLPYVKLFDGSYLDQAMVNTESYFNRIYWRSGCGNRTLFHKFPPKKMEDGKFIE
jgi:hypothetical protein